MELIDDPNLINIYIQLLTVHALQTGTHCNHVRVRANPILIYCQGPRNRLGSPPQRLRAGESGSRHTYAWTLRSSAQWRDRNLLFQSCDIRYGSLDKLDPFAQYG